MRSMIMCTVGCFAFATSEASAQSSPYSYYDPAQWQTYQPTYQTPRQTYRGTSYQSGPLTIYRGYGPYGPYQGMAVQSGPLTIYRGYSTPYYAPTYASPYSRYRRFDY